MQMCRRDRYTKELADAKAENDALRDDVAAGRRRLHIKAVCQSAKLNQIVQKVYGGKRVVLTANAQKQAKQLEALGFGNCPICVAKTQYSLTDDQTKLGAPTDFEVTVRNLKISAGAGFIVALTGEIMTMPGLPKVPAAERIDVDETGKITGLF